MNWKRKLTSRKFWLAVAGLAAGVWLLIKEGGDVSTISGAIMALGAVVAYMVGNGLESSGGKIDGN